MGTLGPREGDNITKIVLLGLGSQPGVLTLSTVVLPKDPAWELRALIQEEDRAV